MEDKMDVEWFRRRIRPLAFFLMFSWSSSLVVLPSPLISFLFSFPTLLRLSLLGLFIFPYIPSLVLLCQNISLFFQTITQLIDGGPCIHTFSTSLISKPVAYP